WICSSRHGQRGNILQRRGNFSIKQGRRRPGTTTSMSVFLLDANVLLALAWSNHEQHDAAHAWCARQRRFRWATCPSTELAFVRISMQPAIVKQSLSGAEALELLERNLQRAGHEFWAEDLPVGKALSRVGDRLVGHKQVMDAAL